ncbi:DNA primase [uncultured Desulfovibrio sp.]|uniref:DNA primase n=1 Tax=uncultured Desulfovibrio sp. TaxID=167968 RepID=UPI00261C0B4D|nr:DNA primase [uncultured Desulfovibrio sp.]
MQSRDAIRAIKERLNITDIVRRYVDLKRNGPRWVAPCPFHQETKPSFTVNEEQGLFYCFGCQASGDIFDFYGRINGLDFRETLEQLAAEAGITLERGPVDRKRQEEDRQRRSSRQTMLRMYELAAAHFAAALKSPEAGECRAYVQRRGLSPEIVERFGLGWARRDWHSLDLALQRAGYDMRLAAEAGLVGRSERGSVYDRFRGRLIFPIKNLSNQIIAFGGRIIADEDEAKYINSSDTPIYKKGEHLYGLAQARKGITVKGRALLTEGYMDVLTLHQFGYDNAVGVLGTALTPDQIKRLSGFTSQLTLLFDGDRAGRKAALRSCEMLLSRGLACTVVLMPEGEDIDSLLRTRGPEAFEALQARAPDGLRFCLDVLRALAPRETVDWAKNFLRHVEVPELVSPYVSRLATHLQLSETELRQGLAGGRRPGPDGQDARPSRARQNMRDRQIMMYAVRYPDRLDDLRDLGADLALQSGIARQLWDKLEEWGADEAPYHLDQREKNFWSFCRGAEAAPRDDGDRELAALRHDLDAYYAANQRQSVTAALRQNTGSGDFAADLEYLRALQETLEQGHEQS